ncbi:MAG: cyclic pyranopterin monophosphate synthase MoaC, partial [Desulfatitalea sp.]|nr:cyclic pyranopterin monophosphate synthase MoaC [Desulfatitalea sp.]
MSDLTHIDAQGRVRMVDVSAKPATERIARAQARVLMSPEMFAMIRDRSVPKGNVLETARIAGVMAAKQTSALIPMCHPLNLTHVQVDFFPQAEAQAIRIEAARA